MAGAGFRDFTVGQILTSQQVDEYLMQQAVMVFASTSARDSAITAPSEGMVAYTSDTDTFWYYSGSAWAATGKGSAWTSYTPSLTNGTLGNGTVSGSYVQQGKLVAFRAQFTLGSTSAVTGSLGIGLPVAAASGVQLCHALLVDTGTATYVGYAELSSSNASLRAQNAAGTYLTASTLSSSIPHTWASTDIVYVNGVYEAS